MTNINTLHQQTRDELGSEDDLRFIPKRFSEKMAVYQGPTVQEERSIGDRFIIGSFTNGMLGVNNPQVFLTNESVDAIWGDATWGISRWTEEYSNIKEILSVTNPNNLFIENFRSDFMIDDASTGALDGTYPGKYTIGSGQQYTSRLAYKDPTSTNKITTALVSVDSDEIPGQIMLSADGGLNYESFTNGVEQSFVNQGYELIVKLQNSGEQLIDSNGDTFITSDGDNFIILSSQSSELNKVTVKYKLSE